MVHTIKMSEIKKKLVELILELEQVDTPKTKYKKIAESVLELEQAITIEL